MSRSDFYLEKAARTTALLLALVRHQLPSAPATRHQVALAFALGKVDSTVSRDVKKGAR